MARVRTEPAFESGVAEFRFARISADRVFIWQSNARRIRSQLFCKNLSKPLSMVGSSLSRDRRDSIHVEALRPYCGRLFNATQCYGARLFDFPLPDCKSEIDALS